MQEASKALEIGSSVLLPPVLDRMDILLALLPEEPSQITTLTAGQVRELLIGRSLCTWYGHEFGTTTGYSACTVDYPVSFVTAVAVSHGFVTEFRVVQNSVKHYGDLCSRP